MIGNHGRERGPALLRRPRGAARAARKRERKES